MPRIELNVIVQNEFLRGDEAHLFFQDELVIFVAPGTSVYELLVTLGAFQSRGQARKNWTQSTAEIPEGFSDFAGIGKLRRTLTILRATKENLHEDQ